MKTTVSNYIELNHAIHNANAHANEPYVINLTGSNEDYLLHDYTTDFFGKTAFPLIHGDLTIEGNGLVIARAEDAVPFRFFGVEQTHYRHKARLTLNDLTLRNGKSWTNGGGAMVNNGEMLLNNCLLEDNVGTLGGAIYNGDNHPLALKNCTFSRNVGLLEGAAVYNANLSQVRLDECLFKENRVVKGQQADIYIFNTVNPIRFVGGEQTASVALNGKMIDKQEVGTLSKFAQATPAAMLLPPRPALDEDEVLVEA